MSKVNKDAVLAKYVDTITVEDWIKTPPVIIQRNHEMRVAKMKRAFMTQADSLRIVSRAIVEKQFNIINTEGDIVATVKPGSYRLDGNTRAEFWDQYPDFRIDDPLIVINYYINSQEDLELEYDAHNTKFAAKNGADDISSAMRSLGLSYKHPKIAKGNIAQSLKYAMADKTANSRDMVEHFADELKIVDDNNLLDFDKKLSGTQHLLCGMLIALKTWSGSQQKRLIDGLVEFTKMCDNKASNSKQQNGLRPIDTYMSGNKMNPLAILYKEYYNGDMFDEKGTRIFPEQKHLLGIRGSSKFADMDQQLDFICYLLKKYVNNQMINDDGIKQYNYDKTYNELADWN